MRRAPAIAGALWLAIAPAAHAGLDFTLPGGYRSLVLKAPGQPDLSIRGAYVPVMWYGGPTRFFRLGFEGGGAYLADAAGGTYSYAVGQTIINFELPIGPLTPYLGVVGHVAYPFTQPSAVTGFPYGVMPQVGLGLDLGVVILDVHAGSGPVWGLSRPGGGAYDTTLTDIGGRASFGF